MKRKCLSIKVFLLSLMLQSMTLSAKQEPLELTWEDLKPKSVSENAPISYDSLVLMPAVREAPVIGDLNNKEVSISGYITPLDFDENYSISEFLLVPFLGACIHVPPPPANQIIYIKSPNGKFPKLKDDDLWSPVTVRGTLKTIYNSTGLDEGFDTLDVASGYEITTDDVEYFEEESEDDSSWFPNFF